MAAPRYEFHQPEAALTPAALPESTAAPYHLEEFANVTFRRVDACLSPYMTPEEYQEHLAKSPAKPAPFRPPRRLKAELPNTVPAPRRPPHRRPPLPPRRA